MKSLVITIRSVKTGNAIYTGNRDGGFSLKDARYNAHRELRNNNIKPGIYSVTVTDQNDNGYYRQFNIRHK